MISTLNSFVICDFYTTVTSHGFRYQQDTIHQNHKFFKFNKILTFFISTKVVYVAIKINI